MATSILFRINNFVLLEYIYASGPSPLTYPTTQIGYRKIKNTYTGYNTIVNNNNDFNTTHNTVDNTVVELPDGRLALLDNDSAYFYPSLDSNIIVSDLVISPPLSVKYDTIRLHILSGYNFDGLDGFVFSLDMRMQNNQILKLVNYAFTKSDTRALFFAPRPKQISEYIYDKYMEIKVPSADYMIDQQTMNPGSTTILPYYFTEGVGLALQNTVYVDYKAIRTSEEENGITYFMTDEHVRFAVASKDTFQSLVASISENTSGSYFEYFAEWDGEIIENFLFRLNSLASNDYVVIHDLIISEQIGSTFQESSSFTDIQTSDYDQIRRFRPILLRSDVAVSFSIDYTVRLYNRADGKSIFKSSSLTSFAVGNYGANPLRLNVGNTSQPIKVYNSISENTNISMLGSDPGLITTKYSTIFIDKSEVRINTDDQNMNNNVVSGDVSISINPFDNIFKFIVLKVNSSGGIAPLDLSGLSNYNMVFIKNDKSFTRIEEYLEIQDASKLQGELYFKINSSRAKEIQNYTNRSFYVTAVDANNTEITIFYGKCINTINL